MLADHPACAAVHYPGLSEHPQHALASRQLLQYGTVLSFEVPDRAAAAKFMASVAIVRCATSLGGPETLVVISSDLSHYHDYDGANQRDQAFRRHVETLSLEKIEDEQACGRFPVKGLLNRARALDLRVTTLDVRNSGDTGGRDNRDRVVG